MNKKVLIAGGAGFIGSNLCEALVNRGDFVLCLDNFVTGSENNIKDLFKFNNFSILEGDITNINLLHKFDLKFDIIINLACIASPKAYYKYPIETLLTSVIGTKNLLDLTHQTGARLIQASTSEVYGDPDVNVLKENYNGNVNCTGPRACYDEGKRAAETLCVDYARIYNLSVQIIRVFNTYGPKMAYEDGRAIPEFICRALRNEEIRIFGSGDQTRSFMFISDLISALLVLIDSNNHPRGPFNIGNPNEEYSISNIAHTIKNIIKSDSKIIFQSKMEDDPRKRKPSIDLFNKIYNWTPSVSIEEGLLKTIKYFKSHV